MKTIEEVIKDNRKYYPVLNNMMPEGMMEVIEVLMKEYAEQALDLAAEKVQIKYASYDSNLHNDPEWDLDNDGLFYQIDKESILSLKDQLK